MKFRMMQKLVRALRSGKYEQGEAQLRTAGSKHKYAYCCLGVATRVAMVAFDRDNYVKGTSEQIYLTERVMNYFGFADRRGVRKGKEGLIRVGSGLYTSLAAANDAGRTFDEIAAAIKANWRDL